MSKRQWIGLATGASVGALLAVAWRLYSERPLQRTASAEEIESPDVACAYARISALPPMMILRHWNVLRSASLVSSGKAVDIGCGPGDFVIALASRAPDLHVTGVDLSAPMLSRAIHAAAKAGLAHRTSFRTGDAACLPFADQSLDLAVSTLSLHHWSNPVAVLDEVARVLRPGGGFLVFDLRRDVGLAPWLVLWFATNVVVPGVLRQAGEPMASRNAAYTPQEVAGMVQRSRLTGWRITSGPFWVTLEGHTAPA